MYESNEIILIVLLLLLGIQIAVLLFMKRMIKAFFTIFRDFKTVRSMLKPVGQNAKTSIAPHNTCHNCQFRLTYINAPFTGNNSFTYRCRLSGVLVSLDHTCDKFQLVSSKSDKQ